VTDRVPPYHRIAKDIVTGNCALFLGAGTSYEEDRGEISTQRLIKHLSQELKKEGFPLLKGEQGLSKVAQYYAIKLGREKMEGSVRSFIYKNAVPLRIHKLLTELPPVIIFTTNYDCNIEDEFEKREREYELIVSQHEFRNWDEKKTIIIKLHGSVNRAISLTITDDDYIEFLMEPSLLKDSFRYILSTRKIIFIGYSLSDYNVKLLLEETNKVIRKSRENAKCEGYVIQDTPWGEQEKYYWKDKGLEIFKLKGDKFLESLRDTINAFDFRDIIGKSFDFWLDNYRLKAISYFEERIVNKFIKDIRENIAGSEDYSFKQDIRKVLSSLKNQKKLIPLFFEESANTIDTILNNVELSENTIGGILVRSDHRKEGSPTLAMLDYLLRKKSTKLSKRIKEHVLFLSEDPESPEGIKDAARAILDKTTEDTNVNLSS